MIERKFIDQTLISLILIISPFRKALSIPLQYLYTLIIGIFVYKYLYIGARPKTLLILGAFIFSILQHTINVYFYTGTLVLSILNIFYPLKVYQLPQKPQNIGYKQFIIQGKFNSKACIFYPSTVGKFKQIDWLLPGTIQKFQTNRRSPIKIGSTFFKFILSYLKKYSFKVRDGQICGQNKGVIIFSHGAGAGLHAYTHLLSEFSRDYIVVTIQHNEIPLVINEEGIQKQNRLQQLQIRSQSLLEALNFFKKQKEVQKIVGNKYKKTKIFLMGHSYGGATVLNTNYITDIQNQVDGIIMLDPWLQIMNTQILQIPLKIKILIISFQSYWKQEYVRNKTQIVVKNNKQKCFQYIIKDARHLDISDVVFVIGNILKADFNKSLFSTINTVITLSKKYLQQTQIPSKILFQKLLVQSPY